MTSVNIPTLSNARKSLDYAQKIADNNKALENEKEYPINLKLVGAESNTVKAYSGRVTFHNGVGKVSSNLYEHLGVGTSLIMQGDNIVLDGKDTQGFSVSSNFNGINIIGREKSEKEELKDSDDNELKNEDIDKIKNDKDARAKIENQKSKRGRQENQNLKDFGNFLALQEVKHRTLTMQKLGMLVQHLDRKNVKMAQTQANARLFAQGTPSATINASQAYKESQVMLKLCLIDAYKKNKDQCDEYDKELANIPDMTKFSIQDGKNKVGTQIVTKQQFAGMVVDVCDKLCKANSGMSFEDAQKLLFPSLTWDARKYIQTAEEKDKAHSNPIFMDLKTKTDNKIVLTGQQAKDAKNAAMDSLVSGKYNAGVERITKSGKTIQAHKTSGAPKRYNLTGIKTGGAHIDFSGTAKTNHPLRKKMDFNTFAQAPQTESNTTSNTPATEKTSQSVDVPPKAAPAQTPLIQIPQIESVLTPKLNVEETKENNAQATTQQSFEQPATNESVQSTHTSSSVEMNNTPLSNEEFSAVTDVLKAGHPSDSEKILDKNFLTSQFTTAENIITQHQTSSQDGQNNQSSTSAISAKFQDVFNSSDKHPELLSIPEDQSLNNPQPKKYMAMEEIPSMQIIDKDHPHEHDHSHTQKNLNHMQNVLEGLEDEVESLTTTQQEDIAEMNELFSEETLGLVLKHLEVSFKDMKKQLFEYSDHLKSDKSLSPAERKRKLILKKQEIKQKQEKILFEKLIKLKMYQRVRYVKKLLDHAKTRETLLKSIEATAEQLMQESTKNTHMPVLDEKTKEALANSSDTIDKCNEELTQAFSEALRVGDIKTASKLLSAKNSIRSHISQSTTHKQGPHTEHNSTPAPIDLAKLDLETIANALKAMGVNPECAETLNENTSQYDTKTAAGYQTTPDKSQISRQEAEDLLKNSQFTLGAS